MDMKQSREKVSWPPDGNPTATLMHTLLSLFTQIDPSSVIFTLEQGDPESQLFTEQQLTSADTLLVEFL